MAVEYASGQIRVSGLTENGASFEDMITNLKSIEMRGVIKLNNWKLDWQERQAAFREVRAQLESLRAVCREINSIDKFLVKSAASSSSVATAVATSEALSGGADEITVGRLATSSIWSLNTGISDPKTELVNNGTTDQYFSYECGGKTRTITVPPGTTLENFRNLINNDSQNAGVTVNLVKSGSEYIMQFKGNNVGSANNVKVLGTDVDVFAGGTYPPYSGKYATSFTSASGVVNSSATDALTFTYAHAGKEYSVNLAPGATLQDLVDAVNSDPGKPAGVSASLNAESDGTYSLQLDSADGAAVTPRVTTLGKLTLGKLTVADNGDPSGTDWHIRRSEDALIKINGWPDGDGNWLVKDSNIIDDVIAGVTVTLQDVGTTVITVNTDTEKIKENVIKFIDAVNEFRALILEKTKIDEGKSTVKPEYAESLYEMQSGSILTGNYGVQLLSSQIKQATAGMPKGFQALVTGGGVGDIYTALSQIGIKTHAEGSGGTDFGMLVLNDDDSLPTLDKVLAANPLAVAELFAAKDLGVSDSSDFSFGSLVSSITRPGAYQVTYEMENGKVKEGTAYINGKAAKVQEDGSIFLAREDPKSLDSSVATALTEGLIDAVLEVKVEQEATKSTSTVKTELTDRADSINTDTDPMDFSYEFNGVTRTIEIAPGSTLDDLVRGINRDKANPGVIAKVVATDDDPPLYNLMLEAKETGANPEIAVTITGGSGALASSGGIEQTAGLNAKYKVWDPAKGPEPAESVESRTNTVTIASGITMAIRGQGTTAIIAVKHNDADGISIVPDNKTDGPYTGQVRVKQGKVNELLSLLDGPAGKTEEGMLGSRGALKILEDNYDKIIAGINSKLEREDERIIKWERTIRARFARLEATLKTYEGLQASIESQIKQLGTNSSK